MVRVEVDLGGTAKVVVVKDNQELERLWVRWPELAKVHLGWRLEVHLRVADAPVHSILRFVMQQQEVQELEVLRLQEQRQLWNLRVLFLSEECF